MGNQSTAVGQLLQHPYIDQQPVTEALPGRSGKRWQLWPGCQARPCAGGPAQLADSPGRRQELIGRKRKRRIVLVRSDSRAAAETSRRVAARYRERIDTQQFERIAPDRALEASQNRHQIVVPRAPQPEILAFIECWRATARPDGRHRPGAEPAFPFRVAGTGLRIDQHRADQQNIGHDDPAIRKPA